ncbi:MAG: mRNA surveillance protein pelota [Candidatus Diapherotrites archaeon]|uniref:Protein pelota homolog n=1 Tax=Candidatus Iainarchaeum sp. TaxID=3101447 RepID=A0A8T3YLD7_9ARCH|nr:mRNA surveillance protein pelota [Candidatus Diapherotrites archaeon]
MQILKVDRKNNMFEAIPDSFDDLWHLERLIEPGDLVSGISERKIKAENEGDKAFRQTIFVEVEVEKTIFHDVSRQLRIQGIVTAASPEELVPLKAHHTIEAEPGRKIIVRKKALRNFHIERLERAKNSDGREKVLLVVMDDEEAELAFLKDTGIEVKARIRAEREGKRFKGEKRKGNPYFEEIFGKMQGLGGGKAVVAGPGFEKQNFEKFLKGKKTGTEIVFESTNSVGTTGLNELIKSGRIDRIIGGFHSAEEAKAVERVLAGIPGGLAAIGMSEVRQSAESGAAAEIAILETMMTDNRKESMDVLDAAEKHNTKTRFVDPESEAGKKLEGIGGIAAVLRYKVKWDS